MLYLKLNTGVCKICNTYMCVICDSPQIQGPSSKQAISYHRSRSVDFMCEPDCASVSSLSIYYLLLRKLPTMFVKTYHFPSISLLGGNV